MQDSIQDLYPGKSIELLKRLHILTRDGKLNLDSRRKLKQVLHLVQFIRPLLEKAYVQNENPAVVDCGAGKSYLGFILYDLILREKASGVLHAIETRADLFEKGKALAKQEGFDRMQWWQGKVVDAPVKSPSLVCALHACDTATDEAIRLGVDAKAQFFALVPCCQAEIAKQLPRAVELAEEDRGLHALWDASLHGREFGSHLTNVLRCLYLQSKGYRVTVTEFTGFEHTQKNELILAEKISDGYPKAEAEYQALCARFKVKPSNL